MKTQLNLILLLLLVFNPHLYAAQYKGTVDFKQQTRLGVTINGTIASVLVSQGDFVKKGQSLIKFDASEYLAQTKRYQAELKHALAEQKQAQRDLQHAKELYERAALSTVSLQDITMRLENLEQRVIKKRALLQKAEYALEQCHVRAPFDGWVLAVYVQPHETLVNQLQSKPLLSLAPANLYVVSTDVPLVVMKSLKQGQRAQVTLGDKRFAARISARAFVANDGKTEQPIYKIKVQFNSEGNLLLQGEVALIEFLPADSRP